MPSWSPSAISAGPAADGSAAAWLWLGIYTIVPVGLLLVGALQLRQGGADQVRVETLPRILRESLLGVGGGLTSVGLALFALPDAVLAVWPWTLTPLTAQAIGAWLIGSGLAAFVAVRENELVPIRPLGAGFTSFALLELVTIARYPGEVAWTHLSTWIYLAFLVVLTPIGLFTWIGRRRLDVVGNGPG